LNVVDFLTDKSLDRRFLVAAVAVAAVAAVGEKED